MTPTDLAPDADQRTLTSPFEAHERSGLQALALTVLWHPVWRLAGAQAVAADVGSPWLLSRSAPSFRLPDRLDAVPLASPALSRTPVALVESPSSGDVTLTLPARTMHCEADGRRVDGATRLDAAAVERGVVLIFGGQVALLLHRVRTLPDGAATGHLAGLSDAMLRVRRLVAQVAPSALPVLVLGESGTGKERVAHAIHAGSPRRGGPLVPVNMAALTESLAAGDLFGAQRGAYTGAQQARTGFWREAEGGTLFLDEIGDTPPLVQPMLLRAIETGRIVPLGATRDLPCDVRLVAATDRSLDASGFNQPLLRRLEAWVVRLPPLRERREDVGLLAARALAEAAPDLPEQLTLPPALVRALCRFDWPGNVRQLLHAMRRLVIAHAAHEWPTAAEFLGIESSRAAPWTEVAEPAVAVPVAGGPDTAAGIDGAPSAAAAAAALTGGRRIEESTSPPPAADGQRADEASEGSGRRYRLPSTVTTEELTVALDATGWRLRDAAERLGVSRPSLYNLLHRHPEVRRAERLRPEDVEAARREGATDLASLAVALRMPREALRRRLQDWADAEATSGSDAGG